MRAQLITLTLRAAKALVAGAGTFAAAVATGYSDGTMTTAEWWIAAAGALGVLGGTYRIPNTKN